MRGGTGRIVAAAPRPLPRAAPRRPALKLFLTDRSHPGGIWNVLHPVAAALRDRGDEPVCVRWRDRAEAFADAPDGVRVVQVDVPPRRRPSDVLRQLRAFRRGFAELLAAERPDVVHANFVLPGAVAVRAARRARFPDGGRPRVVLTRHELFGSLSAPLRALDRASRGAADAVTFVSAAAARSYGSAAEPFEPAGILPPSGGVEPRRSAIPPVPREVVIHNGLDLAEIDAAVDGAGPRDGDRIVCAGRMVPVKGQALLLRAFASLLADSSEDGRPAARLELIGDGPDRPTLEALAGELGVAGRVTFAGWRPRSAVLRAFATAGCVAVPSDGTQEGFGLTAAEAAACGAAVAAGDIPVFREVLGDGAAWFDPRDAAGCAAALRSALDAPAPPDAGARVRRLFGAGRMTGGYLAVYDAGRRPDGPP